MGSQALRSATAFFLLTFSTAFLMTIGIRLTGWFTRAPEISQIASQDLGVAIMIGVVALAVGSTIRRMDVVELRSALIGAASVLLAIPTSYAAINHKWDVSTLVVSSFGAVLLMAGLLVAITTRSEEDHRLISKIELERETHGG